MSTKTEAAKEIEMLDRALCEASNPWYLRFETLDRALEKVDFPYELVQTSRDDLGRHAWKLLYYWRTKSWERGALYINETEAGQSKPGTQNAVDRLRKVLLEAAGEEVKGGAA